MEKQYLSAVELLTIASQHAYCADHLLKQNAEIAIDNQLKVDSLLPIGSLMYLAFELTFKAFLLHLDRPVRQYKKLFELIELNSDIGLSKQDIQLLNTLSRQQAFQKGTDYVLWENREQQQVFLEQIMSLYTHLLALMPLELQSDYL